MPLHKKPHKMNLSFSKYAGVIANVSLIREVAVYIYKELVATSFWNEYKQLQSPSKWKVMCSFGNVLWWAWSWKFVRFKSVMSPTRYSSPERKNLQNSWWFCSLNSVSFNYQYGWKTKLWKNQNKLVKISMKYKSIK